MDLTQEVKDLARNFGADLVGVGSVDRFHDAPKRRHPSRLLEGAQSVVVLGVARSLGEVLCVRRRKSKHPYQYGHHVINEQLGMMALAMANLLECRGHASFAPPVDGVAPEEGPTRASIFSHVHGAVAAGLGDVGWSGLFLSPHLGARQRLASVITTARLEADPILEAHLCADCRAAHATPPCVRACPSGALKNEVGAVFHVGDKEIEVAGFDRSACEIADSGRMGVWCDEEPKEDRNLPRQLLGQDLHWCENCLVFCPLGDIG